jgi:site-specific DNA-methyltransferase (adenine-specific)
VRFITNLSKGILGEPDPIELWEDIISHIPNEVFLKKDCKILFPACGHGTEARVVAWRMAKLGKTDQEINDSFYLIDKYNVFCRCVSMTYNFTNVMKADFLNWETDMKFDVIVGNPPYNDSNNGNIPIYPQFVQKSLELADNVAMVIPSAFAVSNERNGDKVRKLVATKQTSLVKFLPADTFKTANVETLYFVWQRDSENTTRIINGDDEYVTSDYSYIWKNQLLKSILDKCGTSDSAESWIKFNRMENSKTGVSDVDTVTSIIKDKIEITKSNTLDRYVDEHRVVTSFLPNSPYHLDVSYPIKPGIAVKDGYTVSLCATEKEANNLSAYLKSKLVLFIYNKTKTSRTLRSPQLKFIPKVDLNQGWTDQELYSYFNLTQDEIDYIERTIRPYT